MRTGDAYLALDKDWEMQELASLSKLYTQCYSLVYSLSGFKIDSTDEVVIDWFQGAYAKYPWRGGFSTVNFYHALYKKLPYEARPQIKKIQYASPGYILLEEAILVAGMLATIVGSVTLSIDKIHDTYNKIQKGLSERKLTKLEVQLKDLELDSAKLDYVRKSKSELIELMAIPEEMQAELSRRSEGNDLMELKILMSFHRRIEPIAKLQEEGKLSVVPTLEIPSENE
jgi:hypothetical protein